jgi:23S rRNA pseudouridine1911/1915/1917 synthase
VEREFRRTVSPKQQGERLDIYLIRSGIGLSRSRTAQLILEAQVLVNDAARRPSYRVKPGDEVVARFEIEPGFRLLPQPIELKIVYEDDELIVVDKPKGMVVHPARGHPDQTLINGLIYHCGALPTGSARTRPGVVHRLDKDTTGLIVFAKTDKALAQLGRQIEYRTLRREYLGVVWGNMELGRGEIEAPIGRHTLNRKRMAVTPFGSREAKTSFEVLERFKLATLLKLRLATGRTHQIRVHLAHIGHPVIGDPDYGGRSRNIIPERSLLAAYREILKIMDRQALHAARLGLIHPRTRRYMEFDAPLPEDMGALLTYLRHRKGGVEKL